MLVPLFRSFGREATEQEIRVWALALQWLGISTVAYGVWQTRKFFGHPSTMERVREWVLSFPRRRSQTIINASAGSFSVVGGKVRMQIWTNVDPEAPLDDQVKALSKNQDRLRERINQVQDEFESEIQRQSEALRQEQRTRETDYNALNRRLETAETGSLNITVVGLVWLLIGVLLATLPGEIAGL